MGISGISGRVVCASMSTPKEKNLAGGSGLARRRITDMLPLPSQPCPLIAKGKATTAPGRNTHSPLVACLPRTSRVRKTRVSMDMSNETQTKLETICLRAPGDAQPTSSHFQPPGDPGMLGPILPARCSDWATLMGEKDLEENRCPMYANSGETPSWTGPGSSRLIRLQCKKQPYEMVQ